MIIDKKYARERKERLNLYSKASSKGHMHAEITGCLLQETEFPFRVQYTERTKLALVPRATTIGFVDKNVLLVYHPENRTLTGNVKGDCTLDFGSGSFGQVRINLPVRDVSTLTDLLDPFLLYNEVSYHRQLEEASRLMYPILRKITSEEETSLAQAKTGRNTIEVILNRDGDENLGIRTSCGEATYNSRSSKGYSLSKIRCVLGYIRSHIQTQSDKGYDTLKCAEQLNDVLCQIVNRLKEIK